MGVRHREERPGAERWGPKVNLQAGGDIHMHETPHLNTQKKTPESSVVLTNQYYCLCTQPTPIVVSAPVHNPQFAE